LLTDTGCYLNCYRSLLHVLARGHTNWLKRKHPFNSRCSVVWNLLINGLCNPSKPVFPAWRNEAINVLIVIFTTLFDYSWLKSPIFVHFVFKITLTLRIRSYLLSSFVLRCFLILSAIKTYVNIALYVQIYLFTSKGWPFFLVSLSEQKGGVLLTRWNIYREFILASGCCMQQFNYFGCSYDWNEHMVLT